MNHIGDTNKMVSDTPKTEAEVNRQKCWSDDLVTIDANFACQLERELNAANQIAKKYEDRYFAALARIKRLEEAGDKAILNSYLPDRIAMWNKAKEDKL